MPDSFTRYRWRREMHASWQEMAATPIRVMRQDLEFMALEAQANRDAQPEGTG